MSVDTSGVCPACGRYIGPTRCCPYCDADIVAPPLMRLLRWVAILLATVGLLFLYLTVRKREPPKIEIGQIAPSMNFARVCLRGKLHRAPYISKTRDYFSFRLYDKSGNVQVIAHNPVAGILIEEKRLPTNGCLVEVAGQLDVGSDGTRVIVRSPSQLKVVEEP